MNDSNRTVTGRTIDTDRSNASVSLPRSVSAFLTGSRPLVNTACQESLIAPTSAESSRPPLASVEPAASTVPTGLGPMSGLTGKGVLGSTSVAASGQGVGPLKSYDSSVAADTARAVVRAARANRTGFHIVRPPG